MKWIDYLSLFSELQRGSSFIIHKRYIKFFGLKTVSWATKNMKVTSDLSTIYKTIISPAVFIGFRTWSITLREEHRWLRAFENQVLRIIC
jgi:hypothetical protein